MMERDVGEKKEEGKEEGKVIIAQLEESIFADGGVWMRGPLLGFGGYGTVHLANLTPAASASRYEGVPPLVAVKSTPDSNSTAFEKLVLEKKTYDALGQSPFLIRCFGDDATASESGAFLYNVFLEYAPGGTLWDLIAKSDGLGLLESQARGFARSILGGIKHIHEAGFAHCDLKPENVLLVGEGGEEGEGEGEGFVAKIGDLGLAKSVHNDDTPARGTDMYLAPECLEKGIQGQASDIWALGCVVFSMLTGTLWWSTTVAPEIGEVNMADPSLQLLSEEAEDFVSKCLSRNPGDRPTAAALLSHPFVTGCSKDDEKKKKKKKEEEKSLALVESEVCEDCKYDNGICDQAADCSIDERLALLSL